MSRIDTFTARFPAITHFMQTAYNQHVKHGIEAAAADHLRLVPAGAARELLAEVRAIQGDAEMECILADRQARAELGMAWLGRAPDSEEFGQLAQTLTAYLQRGAAE